MATSEIVMRHWIIVGATIMAAVTNASAQSDRTAPPAISSTPNLGCQARTGGLAVPAQGETTGSANLGVICPPAEVDPGIPTPPTGRGVMPVVPPPGTLGSGIPK
jgi:hypothetical protein